MHEQQSRILSVSMRARDMVPGKQTFLLTGQPQARLLFSRFQFAVDFINHGRPETIKEDRVTPASLAIEHTATTGQLDEFRAAILDVDPISGLTSMSVVRRGSHGLSIYAAFGDFLYETSQKTDPTFVSSSHVHLP